MSQFRRGTPCANLAGMVERGVMGKKQTNQGIPTRSVFWMLVNEENIPSNVAEAEIIMKSQKFSWASGHWYFRCRTRISVRAIFVRDSLVRELCYG